MKKFTTILLLGVFTSGCVAPVFFEEAQPSFAAEEVRFTEQYLGSYINYEDSTYLTILEQAVLVERNEFESGKIDTLFNISDNNVLKYYKGKYFLNYRDEENDWVLYLVDLDKSILSFYCFDVPDDEGKVEKFGAIRLKRDECGDVVKLVIQPTKRGFNKLLKKKNLVRLRMYDKLDK